MTNAELLDACRRLTGNKEVYYATPADLVDARGEPNFKLLFAGEQIANDYVTLLRHLPDLAKHHVELSATVEKLAAQVASLSERLDIATAPKPKKAKKTSTV